MDDPLFCIIIDAFSFGVIKPNQQRHLGTMGQRGQKSRRCSPARSPVEAPRRRPVLTALPPPQAILPQTPVSLEQL